MGEEEQRSALLLGMYFSTEMNPSRGQGFRDRVRCEALESCDYKVYTLDNKHDESDAKEGRFPIINPPIDDFVDRTPLLRQFY
jgi:hypothetical protein